MLDYEKINKILESTTFSVIGCVLPEKLDKEVKEVLDLVFNKISINPKDMKIIKTSIQLEDKVEEQIFTENQIKILENIISVSTNDEIVSRIGVVLWAFNKNYGAVKKAIEAYQNLYKRKRELDEVRQDEALQNIIMAFTLMIQLNQKDVIKFICDAIDENIAEEKDLFAQRLLVFLIEKKKFKRLSDEKKKQYKEYLKNRAKEDCGSAIFLGDLLVKIAQNENDKTSEKEAYLLIANECKRISDLPNSHQMQKSTALGKATEFYKKAGEEILANNCILESQRILKDKDKWTSHKIPVDLKSTIDCFDQYFIDTDVAKSIKILAQLTEISYDTIIQQHKVNEEENPFYVIASRQSIDDKGVIRSSQKGLDINNSESEKPYLIRIALDYVGLQAFLIDYFNAKYVLSEVNKVTFSEIIEPHLPQNIQVIEYILQMILSGHSEIVIEPLLVSFETFLAALLEQNGFPSIKQLDDSDVQEDLTMGALLTECEKHGLLDRDDSFLIEALLCNNNGWNLRNISNHRLVPDSERFSAAYLFCGYFLIRLFIKYGIKKSEKH